MKIPVFARLATPILAITLIAACAGPGSGPDASENPDAGQPTSSEPEATREPAQTVSPESDPARPSSPASVPESVWAAILDDLARRLGESITDPTVVSAEAVTWNDGSLGCPKPGEVYTQALVDGYKVVVEVDGERFDYRSAGGDSVRLCESPIEGGG